MAINISEEMSTLRDDEMRADEAGRLLARMAEDQALRAQWERVQLIGDLMRGHYPVADASGIQARVAEALRDEPVVLAPKRRLRRPGAWRRPVLGSAVAASLVGAAAWIWSPTEVNQTSPLVASQVPFAEQEPVPIEQLPSAGLPVEQLRTKSGTYWQLKPGSQLANKLNDLMVDHGEFASVYGFGRMGPYASFVSYDAQP